MSMDHNELCTDITETVTDTSLEGQCTVLKEMENCGRETFTKGQS